MKPCRAGRNAEPRPRGKQGQWLAPVESIGCLVPTKTGPEKGSWSVYLIYLNIRYIQGYDKIRDMAPNFMVNVWSTSFFGAGGPYVG